ncbi:MAG: LacI family transcriptional regulator [Anaerohalosphaeraceae bacterium]|nr:LacI family transcriptional regulator [Anaerohalosphaeraceae bacterium]
MAVTITDIANEAKVARGTVSDALRGKPGPSRQTRQHIVAVAKQMGYRPNLVARSLTLGKTNLIGVIAPEQVSGSAYYQNEFHIIETTLKRAGFSTLLTTYSCIEEERKCILSLEDRKVDAILCVSAWSKELNSIYEKVKIPIVITDGLDGHIKSHSITIDRSWGILAATEHLLGLGHRDIVLFLEAKQPVLMPMAILERIMGFEMAFRRRGIEIAPWQIAECEIKGSDMMESFYLNAKKLLAERKFTAIIGVNDMACIAIKRAIDEAGLRVPDDISLIGHDDLDFAAYFSPPLTTIARATEELLGKCISLVVELAKNGQKKSYVNEVLRTKLVVRQTTAKCPNV